MKWQIAFKLKKYKNENAYKNSDSFDEKVIHGNLLLFGGVKELLSTIGGLGGRGWTAGITFIGVGSGVQDINRTQTGLQGSGQQYKQILAGFPRLQENYVFDPNEPPIDICLEYSSTFFGNEANFTWNEFTVASGTSQTDINRINLNRKLLEDKSSTKLQLK